jgi:hypothetical protein
MTHGKPPFNVSVDRVKAPLVYVEFDGMLSIPFTKKMESKKNGECYRQNHRDRTNLCSWDSIRNEDKTAPPGTRMVILFSSGIDRQGPFFSWYQVQQKDAYQLHLIGSYGG